MLRVSRRSLDPGVIHDCRGKAEKAPEVIEQPRVMIETAKNAEDAKQFAVISCFFRYQEIQPLSGVAFFCWLGRVV